MNKTIEQINMNRQTVKAYSDQRISNEDWKNILETIYWAPTSHGFEPYRTLIIEKDNKLREELKPLMWNQGVVTEADKLLLFISLKREVFANKEWVFKRSYRRFADVAGKTHEEASKLAKTMSETVLNKHLNVDEANGDDWAMKQCYIALGMAMSAATILGIGSTPMEGIEKSKVEELLLEKELIKKDERIAVTMAFGYPKSETAYLHFGKGNRVRDKWEEKFKTI
ncbi:MAG: nitroreductase family protein [Mycoplasmatales bacterium]|nr:nitroreductase family protein [Mycoplasmatales bacterium]